MKTLTLPAVSAALFILALPSRAQTTLPAAAEAAVRDGTNVGLDLNEATLGYCMVKYSTTGTSGKSYFKFDFAGHRPNTNANLGLVFTTFNNSQRQHVQVWSLNQAYPAFTSGALIWNTSQANDTAGNGMITNSASPFNARPLVDFISPGGALTTRTVTLPAPWGGLIVEDKLVLVLTSLNDPATNQNNGLRIQTNTTALVFAELVGQPPTVSELGPVSVLATQSSAPLPFNVGDPENGATGLQPVATSSDESVVPSANITFGGSGANRTVTITGGTVGRAEVTVTVTDADGNAAQRTFVVTVLPLDFPPVLSPFTPVHTLHDTVLTLPFTVNDAESGTDALVLSATVATASVPVLESATIGGSGTARSLTITPVSGSGGVGVVTVTATDPASNVTSATFPVMVRPAPSVVFCDAFDYPDGQLFAGSSGLWTLRGGLQSVKLRTQGQQAWIHSSSTADDGVAGLVGAPFAAGGHAVLYTTFKATWVDLGQIPIVGTSVGPFVHLYDPASATLVCEVATSTNGVPEGSFRLRIANGGVYTDFPRDLTPGVTYAVSLRYDVDAARSTLWVDGTTEASASVTATDPLAPLPIAAVGLRQDRTMGEVYVDDLKVSVFTRPAINSITPPAEGRVHVDFSAGQGDGAGDFILVRANDVNGPYVDAGATITVTSPGLFRAVVQATAGGCFYQVQCRARTF